jgi:hypothetical protein
MIAPWGACMKSTSKLMSRPYENELEKNLLLVFDRECCHRCDGDTGTQNENARRAARTLPENSSIVPSGAHMDRTISMGGERQTDHSS